MGAFAIPAAIQGVTSLIGGIIGSTAASKAAKQQAQQDLTAAQNVTTAGSNAVKAGYDAITQSNTAINSGLDKANQGITDAQGNVKNIYDTETSMLQPYQAAGLQSLNKLQSSAGTFQFNPADLQNDPGYQFQLQQGLKALGNSAATRGMLQSGATLKNTEQYAQGLAGTSYTNAYNRALSTYNTNQQGLQSLASLGTTANSQALQAGGTYGGQVTSLAGLGANTNMQGAGLLANTALQGNEYVGNSGLKAAEDSGNFLANKGAADASGTIGSANAWSGALSGVGNAAQLYSLSQLGKTGSGTASIPSALPQSLFTADTDPGVWE